MWMYRSLQFCLPSFISLHIQHASIFPTTSSVMWRCSSHLWAHLLFSHVDRKLLQSLRDPAISADLSTEAERKSDRLPGNRTGGRLAKMSNGAVCSLCPFIFQKWWAFTNCSWLIMLYSFCCAAKWLSCTCTHSFSYSSLLQLTTRYWIEFPVREVGPCLFYTH